jgi:TorA maturation chaperone TorD
MKSDHAEKSLSKNHDAPSARREAAGLKKIAVLAQQDAEARGNMYRFLSAVYLRPPTEELVRRLADNDFLDELSSLFGGETVEDLRKLAATVHPDKQWGTLKQEYMDLFAVPTGRYITPFEDV